MASVQDREAQIDEVEAEIEEGLEVVGVTGIEDKL